MSSFVQALDRMDSDLDRERSQHRDLALTAINKFKKYNKSYYDSKHKTLTAYTKGDLVLIRELSTKPGENKKFKMSVFSYEI